MILKTSLFTIFEENAKDVKIISLVKNNIWFPLKSLIIIITWLYDFLIVYSLNSASQDRMKRILFKLSKF